MNKMTLERITLVVILIGGAVGGAIAINVLFPGGARYPVGIVVVGAALWHIVAARRNAIRYVAKSLPLWRTFDVSHNILLLRLMGLILTVGGVARLTH